MPGVYFHGLETSLPTPQPPPPQKKKELTCVFSLSLCLFMDNELHCHTNGIGTYSVTVKGSSPNMKLIM